MIGPAEQPAPLASDSDDRSLHARLVSRDPIAPADLANVHLGELVRRLRLRFPRVNDHLLQDVAIDLLLDLAKRPEQYQPTRGGLAGYLRMAATADVKNALRSERRRSGRLAALTDVELAQRTGNFSVMGPADPGDLAVVAEFARSDTMALIRAHFTPQEQAILQLHLDGERRTPAFAALLGIEQWPPAEQAREVKRAKDRLLKRLRRLAPKVRRDD